MRRAVRFLIVPAMILALAGCSRDPESQSKRLVDSGNKFFEKGKFKEASMQFRRAIQKFPKNQEAYYRLGLTSLKTGDFPTAVQSLRRAVDLKPDNIDAATKLADVYWLAYVSDPKKPAQLKNEIAELSSSLLKRDAKSFDGLRLAGYLALAENDAPGALAKFRQANDIKPYQPELTMVLVQTLLGTKQPEEAEKMAKDFIAHQKNYAPMYDQLVMLYLMRSQLPEAEQLLKQKIENNPAQEAFYLQLAAFYVAVKRPVDMENTLQRLTNNPKDFPLAHLTIGRFFFRLKDFDRTRREYEEGTKATPKEKAAYQKAMVELLAVQGKSAEARAVVDEVLKADPKDLQAIEMRSALQLQTGNPSEIQNAVTDLQSLVTKNPENPIYHFNLGRALLANKNADQARLQFEEAIRLRPDYTLPKILLARVLAGKGDHAKSLQMVDEVLRVDPNSMEARLLRSSALIMLGEREKAKAELDALLKKVPNSPDAKFQLGLINYGEKNYKEADAIFRQMQEANPGDNRGLIGVVETQVAQKDYAGAIGLMELQLQRDPNRQDLRMALANVLVRAERYDDAITQFKALGEKNQKSPEIPLKLGEVYRLKGDLNAAVDAFRKASQIAPNDPLPLTRLAMLLDGLGRRGEAKPLYEQVLRLKPDEPVALNNLAFIKAEEGTDLDTALALAQRAKQALPTDPMIADTLGWVYIKKSLSEDAVRVFRELIVKYPQISTFRYHLAMALYQKGDKVNAKKECEVALQNKPSQEEAGKIRELMQKLG